MEKNSGSGGVQSLDRAFDLLELLCRSQNGMAIHQLSEITGLHKSTVHRLLAAMASRGYVRRDPENAVYRAGMRLCELSEYIQENLDVVARAREPMERLSRATGETVHLVAREGAEIVYVYKVESIHGAIRMVSRIGMRRPLYCTGVGRPFWPPGDEEVLQCWEERARRPLHHHPEGRLPPGDRPDPAAGLCDDGQRRERAGGALRSGGHPGLARGCVLCPVHLGSGVPHDRRAGPQSDPRPVGDPERDLRLPGGAAGMTGGVLLGRECEDVQKGTVFPCGAVEKPL